MTHTLFRQLCDFESPINLRGVIIEGHSVTIHRLVMKSGTPEIVPEGLRRFLAWQTKVARSIRHPILKPGGENFVQNMASKALTSSALLGQDSNDE